jgi:hypothetical protein
VSDTPAPRSFQQILGDLVDAFLAAQGISNIRVGSPILSILEATAQSDLRSSQDIFELLNSISLDLAEGLALERIGNDENISKIEASAATGTVTISDSSFTKIFSKLSATTPAPIVGSVAINVVDASTWPASGQVYIGRGTPNYEGPLAYSSKVNAGTHWTLNLSSGTVRFHNTSETAILAQGGNRVIAEKTQVNTPQANVSSAIVFRTRYARTIPDGETEIFNVQVVAVKEGIIGNVPVGAITEFQTAPFNGATVTNPTPFSNGTDTETDDDFRERIRNVRRSRALGTALAITTATIGIVATDENKRISSSTLVKRFGIPSILYIDDGTGYEERTQGVAIETLTASALGGEPYFETDQRPIARAFAITSNVAPFTLGVGAQLAVRTGGVDYVHLFDPAEFHSIVNASAFEIVASINKNPALGFLARTANGGANVVIFSKSETNEDIGVVAVTDGLDANVALGFPIGQNFTMQLYKNDRLLTKDGQVAAYSSLSFSEWNAVTGNQTLIVAVDGTAAATYTFTDQDFIDAGTGFNSLARNTLAAWALVFNFKVPGITAVENAGKLILTSNLGTSSRARASITGGTLVTAHFFSIGEVHGAPNDYTLDRNEAQIHLATPLVLGDRLTVGSTNTRAFIQSDTIGTTTIAGTARLWFVVDGDAQIVKTGVTTATTITISVGALHNSGAHALISSAGTPFANVLAGDWVIIWDPSVDVSMQGAFRVLESGPSIILVERRQSVGARIGHRTVALQASGSDICRVLTTGGSLSSGFSPTDTCEIYDPNIQASFPVASMTVPRAYHTCTLLSDGKVLVTGGKGINGNPLDSIEIYDPVANTWTAKASTLPDTVFNHQAILLVDNSVLICGGDDGSGGVTTIRDYVPGSDTFVGFGAMVHPRGNHKIVLLPSNNVLVVGGYNAVHVDQLTAEIIDTTLFTSAPTGSMTRARSGFGLSLVEAAPTKVLAAGNRLGATGKDTYEIYTIGAATWGAETALPSNCVFEDKDLVRVANGNVFGFHGWDSTLALTTGKNFKYDGTTFTSFISASALDTTARWQGQYVHVANGTATIKNLVVAIGGSVNYNSTWGYVPSAFIETYDAVGATWSAPEPAAGFGINLTGAGMAFVRTDGLVHEMDVAPAANYTASSIVGVLNTELVGASAAVYKTNQLRVSTNSFAKTGDIALVAQNSLAGGIALDSTSAIENLTGHIGSVESGNSELGTPSFQDMSVRSLGRVAAGIEQPVLNIANAEVDRALVGLRNQWLGSNGSNAFGPPAFFYPRAGSNYGFRTRIKSAVLTDTLSRLDVRLAPGEPWTPLDRVYLAAPYAIGPNDDFAVTADNDIAKRFPIQMWRKLNTVGSTYATTNTFKDGGAAGVSLAVTFGLNFNFNDFAVYMAARAVAFTVANQKMLFRYYRLGADGNGARVRFGHPTGPNKPWTVVSVQSPDDLVTEITIQLKSGALRTISSINNTTRLGQSITAVDGGGVITMQEVLNLIAGSASRTTNVTTVTPTLPAGVTDHGFSTSDKLWIASTDVNFSSGLKTITRISGTQFSYPETAADIGPTANIGTVSFDNLGEASFTGSSATVGDFIRLNTIGGYNKTARVTAVAAGGQGVTVSPGDTAGGGSPSTVITWAPINVPSNLQLFINPAETAGQAAAAINALAALPNPTCPITATLLGNGTGLVDRSTVDLVDNFLFWYTLTDGVNWVAETTPPLTIVGDYTLTFKNPITGSLSTTSDWVDETVHIAPTTAQNVVDWLNAPTVSGLFTACSIQTSNDGRNVQISSLTPGANGGVQVQGGLANSVTAAVVGASVSIAATKSVSTIKTTESVGIGKGMWCRIDNTDSTPSFDIFNAGMSLASWDADGLVRMSAPVINAIVSPIAAKLQFERQGGFIAISDMGINSSLVLTTVKPGSFVRITPTGSPTFGFPQVSSANQGVFKVLRVDLTTGHANSGTIYIENAAAFDERVECTIAVYGKNSIMPGDGFIVSSPVFGAGNQGSWTVTSVGTTTATSNDPFATTDRFTVDVSSRTPVPQGASAPLTGVTAALVYATEAVPSSFIMRVDAVAPNQTDGSFTDIRWDDDIHASAIGAAAGSIITVLDKLAFSTSFAAGLDGYSFNTGLIGEANKVVYGDPANTATYPGVAAAGAQIDISGPLVKRISIALQLRVRSGVSNKGVGDRVRSAVATVINQSPHGRPISFSSIIGAAEKIVGIGAVTIVSPIYNAGNDSISVQPSEKPLIVSLENDISITFKGD